MSRKPEETPTYSNQQPILSNPYEQNNSNQRYQQPVEQVSDEQPPPYTGYVSPKIEPKPELPNPVQSKSYTFIRINLFILLEDVLPNNAMINPPLIHWGRRPIQITCPYCQRSITTRVRTSSTVVTFLLALGLCFVCLCLGLIPFFLKSCKKSTHICPDCNRILNEISEFE